MCFIKEFIVILSVFIGFIACSHNQHHGSFNQHDLTQLVRIWADTIGARLQSLSETITRKKRVIESFKETDVIFENGTDLRDAIADELRVMVVKKVQAVKKIVQEAERLSYYRKKDIFRNSSYGFYDTTLLDDTDPNPRMERLLQDRFIETNLLWDCDRKQTADQHANINENFELNCRDIPYIEPPKVDFDYFTRLPLEYHQHFKEEVNLNYSVVRVSPSVYSREETVLNAIRMSEALDQTFRENYQNDRTLTWQYFASSNGFLRLYPAMEWSEEQYDQTFEYRTRSWYLEAGASPKDVIILLDKSGSMQGYRRFVAKTIVNNLLDTLGDNDYVNVYVFSNETKPLVTCFNDTLVQAHEENLRLIREHLGKYRTDNISDIYVAFKKALEVLASYREGGKEGAQCNQVVMLITEGIDYDYKFNYLFDTYNPRDMYYRPVRIFTYLIGTEQTDARELLSIACANMGYYVNISKEAETTERVLKYFNVLSRPLNLFPESKPDPIWTGVYVDLGDRRLSNWLFNKSEGIRQRDIFLNYIREVYKKNECIMDGNLTDNVLFPKNVENHAWKSYEKTRKFTYMTTVSWPAYDRRPNKIKILGVAGVDVPNKYLEALFKYYRLGVNGYAFIVTNNGLVVTHPDHRKEDIVKPTFNRVDITEVELLDDMRDPRDFNESLLQLRQNIVQQFTGSVAHNVKTHVDNMRRVILSRRHYFYTYVGPFSLILAIPDKYGFYKIKHKEEGTTLMYENMNTYFSGLLNTKNWKIHPDWRYCDYFEREPVFKTPEDKLLFFIKRFNHRWPKECDDRLVNSLILDAKVTEWFEKEFQHLGNSKLAAYAEKNLVHITFLATYSGLTRWKTIDGTVEDEEHFSATNNKAIDEVWYKRAVEFIQPTSFLYSVPLIKPNQEFDDHSLVTVSSAVYREDGGRRTPAATVGFQFYHKTLLSLFTKVTTTSCGSKPCKLMCGTEELSCFILDNNAYIVASDNITDTGRFIGDVRPDIAAHLIHTKIYKYTRIYDYQGICYVDLKKAQEIESGSSHRHTHILTHIFSTLYWGFIYIFNLIKEAFGGETDKGPCVQLKSKEYVKHKIEKVVPTPCDNEMWLYSLVRNQYNTTNENVFTKPECIWPFIIQPIPESNLILLVVNGLCLPDMTDEQPPPSPHPREIIYGANITMPCYIANKNSFYRRQYIKCFNRDSEENYVNQKSLKYCGGEDNDKKDVHDEH